MNAYRQQLPVTITVILGSILSVLAYFIVARFDYNEALHRFESFASEQVIAFEEHVNANLRGLQSIVTLFGRPANMSSDVFRSYAASITAVSEDILALQWLSAEHAGDTYRQSVPNKPSPAQRLRVTLNNGVAGNKAVTVSVREDYNRQGSNETPDYGDLTYSEMTALLQQAADGAAVRLSRSFTYADAGRQQRIVMLAVLVFGQVGSAQLQPNDARSLYGFILAQVSIDIMLDRLYAGHHWLDRQHSIDFYLFDIDMSGQSQLLYRHNESPVPGELKSFRRQLLSGPAVSHAFRPGGRQWEMIARPDEHYFDQGVIWSAWLALLVGLLFSALLALYIHKAVRERVHVEQLVDERTRSLHESQGQFQATVSNLLEGVITISEQGLIETFNLAAESIFLYKAEQVLGRNVRMLMPEPYHSQHDEYLQQYLQTGDKKIVGIGREVQGLRSNGEIFPLQLAVSELRLADRTVFIGVVHDLSERQKASEELDRFKYVLDNTLDMIFMFTTGDLRFVYLNRGAVESMGYSSDEMLQMTPYDIKPEYPEHRFRTMIKPLLDGDEDVLHFETVHRRKNGTDFPVEIFLQLVREAGDDGRFIAIVRDITERKQSEKQASRYVRALEELHHIASRSLDFDESVTALLQLGRDFFRLPLAVQSRIDGERFIIEHAVGSDAPRPGSELVLSETYCDRIVRERRALGYHRIGSSEISNHPCYRKYGLEAHIGTPLIVRGRIYGTMNFSGKQPLDQPFTEGDFSLIKIFAQWLSHVITRQQIQDDLQDKATRLASILDTAIDAIITFNEEGIIESVNAAGLQLFGYESAGLLGERFIKLLPPQDARQYMQYLQEYLHTGETQILGRMIEADGLRNDGSLVPIEFAANVMRLCGKRYFTAVVRDISERKRVERMKSEFVSTVSHELRTPLTSIRGALSLVLGKTTDILPDKVRRLLDMASRNSERLTYLINDILDLEKIDAGQLEFELQCIDLPRLVQRAIDDNETYASSHQVRLEFGERPHGNINVQVDPNRLLQVMANLISNAVKFSPPGAAVRIDIHEQEGHWRVSVRDQGSGIPAEFRPRIFMRFAQADSSDSRDKGGTGLGLAITKAIIERHGGRIDYNSEAGKGTEFFFDLPQWHDVLLAEQAASGRPRVLICEDNADVAEILNRLLEQDGYSSDRAATLNDARDLLAKYSYQLLLLDLKLPDGDGLQLVQEIRNDEKLLRLPVIVISARAGEARQEFHGDAFPIIDWMEKPIDHVRLSVALQQVMAGQHRPRVLHVEDDLDIVQVTRILLEEVGDIDYVTTLAQARERLQNNDYDLLILDLKLPDGSGLDLLDEIQGYCPVVIFSGVETERAISDKVAAALTKSRTDSEQLLRTVRRVLSQSMSGEVTGV